MTKQEYDIGLKLLEKEYDTKCAELMKKYALSNNSVIVGEIISDHTGTIQVESAKFYLEKRNPCMIYYGKLVNKNGTFRKDGKTGSIYQPNIVKK